MLTGQAGNRTANPPVRKGHALPPEPQPIPNLRQVAQSKQVSAFPEDMEGSGFDLDSSGSGSGDWSEKVSPGKITNIVDHPHSKDLTFDNTNLPASDIGSEFALIANSKSFLESKEIITAIIAGGVTGVILAAVLTGLLIYKWYKQDDGGYIMGQQSHKVIL